jgi:hypothetical protein
MTIEISLPRTLDGACYDRKLGAACPGEGCGERKPKVVRTLPWEHGVRVRYHRCQRCGVTFKSLEEEAPPAPEPAPAPAPAAGFRSNLRHPLARG